MLSLGQVEGKTSPKPALPLTRGRPPNLLVNQQSQKSANNSKIIDKLQGVAENQEKCKEQTSKSILCRVWTIWGAGHLSFCQTLLHLDHWLDEGKLRFRVECLKMKGKDEL